MKTVEVEKAVGSVLMHDITRIVPGKYKGPAFKKGHIVTKEDISLLKDLGKESLYIYDMPEDEYHEDDAAELFKAFAGSGVDPSGSSEGKVLFISGIDGFINIDRNKVDAVNSIGDIVLTTVHSKISVRKNEKIAGVRIIPLTIDKRKAEQALKLGTEPFISVSPFKEKKTGLIITGSEVASGRIKDGFFPVIKKKIEEYKSSITACKVVGDDIEGLKKEILALAEEDGCDLIILTGGMSVDPDDLTKKAIKEAGVEVVSYGAPILPGNMFMIGYLNEIPVFGVPACALYFNITVMDIFLPYVFSDTKITEDDIIKRGYGGYCRHCNDCSFPRCGFGKY